MQFFNTMYCKIQHLVVDGVRIKDAKIFNVNAWQDHIIREIGMLRNDIQIGCERSICESHMGSIFKTIPENKRVVALIPVEQTNPTILPNVPIHRVGIDPIPELMFRTESLFPFDNMMLVTDNIIYWCFRYKGRRAIKTFSASTSNVSTLVWVEYDDGGNYRTFSALEVVAFQTDFKIIHLMSVKSLTDVCSLILRVYLFILTIQTQPSEIGECQVKKGVGKTRKESIKYSVVKINPLSVRKISGSIDGPKSKHRSPIQHDVRGHIRRYRNADGTIRKIITVRSHTRGNPELGKKITEYEII